MTTVITPSPYLRDGLRRLVTGLRKDAETVRLNLAQAEQDVAAARQLLAEAEAQHKRAKDQVNALDAEIAFFEEQAERTPPAYDPDAALAATGLMPRDQEAPQHTGGNAEDCPVCRPQIDQPGGVLYPWHCPGNGDPDDLTAPGVTDSRAQVVPHLPPPVPHGPAGPLMTMPDLGPARERLDPPPGQGTHTHAKDRPGLFARLTGGHRIVHDEQDGGDPC